MTSSLFVARRGRWAAAALLVFAIVATGSWLASSMLAHGEADRSRRDFRASAAHITSTLQLAVQHEEDLIVSAQGFEVTKPQAPHHERRKRNADRGQPAGEATRRAGA